MIETTDISYTYKGGATLSFPNIHVEKNLLILGPSGVGKTTLLHLLAGLLTPSKGEIVINGQAITDWSKSQLDQYRGAHIGIVFQQSHLIRSLTVKENLAMIQKIGKQDHNPIFINEILARLGLLACENQMVNKLSQGQKQRVSIGMALINQPDIILADEPTSSLDDVNTKQVMELLLEQASVANAQLITITHDQRIKPYFQNQIYL